MPPCLDTVTGQVTAPGATVTALTAVTGDSYSIRAATAGKAIWLINYWARCQAAGIMEVKSPRMHDNVRAIRERIPTADTMPLGNWWTLQPLYPMDVLTVSLAGSSTGGQIEQASLLVYYQDLPGISAQFAQPSTLQKSGVNEFQVEVAITPGSAGGYSGQAAINATFDTYIANTLYALVGMKVDAQCCSACVHGPDTGNLRVSIPGDAVFRSMTAEWFTKISEYSGIPMIPVINSANKFGTFVDIVQNQAAAAVNVTLMFIQLAPGTALP